MINTSQNTNFKSRIVVSSSAYQAKPLRELEKSGKLFGFPSFSLDEVKFLLNEGFTAEMRTCSAGTMKAKDGNEFFGFHFDAHDPEYPWKKSYNAWHHLEKGLLDAQERIRGGVKNTQLRGFLFGAYSAHDFENRDESMEQAQNLVRFFQDTGVKFSALLGQRSKKYGAGREETVSHFHYSLPKDEYTVSFNKCSDVKTIEDLRKSFEIVILDEGDTFEFRGD